MATDHVTEPGDGDHGDDPDTGDRQAEDRYRRRVGIVLALLALLGAGIALLQTDASIAEATTAREATRLAAEAQSSDVLARGLASSVRHTAAEVDALSAAEVFSAPATLGPPPDLEVDPSRAEQRADAARDTIESSFAGRIDLTALAEEAAGTELQQAATVTERISWNTKSSEYGTVLTVLAIAIFLVGFTLVLARKLRPPIAVPGGLLALYCAGWAAVIYAHPIPRVDPEVIEFTAQGQVALESMHPAEARTAFSAALRIEDSYVPALRDRALATLLEVNPDLLRTLAVTGTDEETLDSALADLRAAIAQGGEDDAGTMKLASLMAILDGRWDQAEGYLDRASELDGAAAALYLWHAAVAVALDEPDVARDWLGRATEVFSDLGTRQSRELASQYLTLLEVVSERSPAQAGPAADSAESVVAAGTARAVDRELEPGEHPGVTFDVAQADFDAGTTELRFDLGGLDADDAIAIVGYVRPSPGADWVQPSELYFAGPATIDDAAASIRTPWKCTPVEWRFDLYVEGERTRETSAPGGAPTC